MRWLFKTQKRSVTEELARAISSYNIKQVSFLLSDTGKFAIQNEDHEIIFSDRQNFINWLTRCYSEYKSIRKSRKKLKFTIIQSMHSLIDNSIVIFEGGIFPVLFAEREPGEKNGLIIQADKTKISWIGFCLLKLKTQSPYIYEKRNL